MLLTVKFFEILPKHKKNGFNSESFALKNQIIFFSIIIMH